MPFTALEASYQQVDFVRRFGNKVYYGDASRLELLQAAHAQDAKLFVLAIDDVEASVRTAAARAQILPAPADTRAGAQSRPLLRLRDLGIKWIYRETFPASLEAAHQALLQLGLGIATSERAITMFKQHDEAQLEAQYAVRHDDVQLVQNAKDAAEQLRGLFESDVAGPLSGLLQADERRASRGAAPRDPTA